ncbi:MAG: flagellar hook-basal body complex protein [Planctomycetes bacterium]|nr:flagellar hook-basal body complex protein [Planctomycetota bacterium]
MEARWQWAAAAGSWVTITMIMFRSRARVARRFRTCSLVCESRLPVGSSASSSLGRFNSARASAVRCRSPVLSSAGTGRLLEPAVKVPPDTIKIEISPQGLVSVLTSGNPGVLTQAGQIDLAIFPNPQGLLKRGENLYSVTEASGSAVISTPGIDGLGKLRNGALEQSNVQPVRELIDLITTQRAFEMNSQAVQAADQMLQLVANLRRF